MILAAFGNTEFESDAAEAKAFAGAIILYEMAHNLTLIRQALTSSPQD